MISETKDIAVYNPFDDKYTVCFCRFELKMVNGNLVNAELVEVISQGEVSMFDWVPLKERGAIELNFEREYRENYS